MEIHLYLLLNALIILLVGLVCGAPMGKAIISNKSQDEIRAWRVAHTGLTMGGVMLIAFSLVMPKLKLGEIEEMAVIIPSLLSAYGFAIGLPLGAISQNRGLTNKGNWKKQTRIHR